MASVPAPSGHDDAIAAQTLGVAGGQETNDGTRQCGATLYLASMDIKTAFGVARLEHIAKIMDDHDFHGWITAALLREMALSAGFVLDRGGSPGEHRRGARVVDRFVAFFSCCFLNFPIFVLTITNHHVFKGPDDLNGYGYVHVRLYWTEVGFQATSSKKTCF